MPADVGRRAGDEQPFVGRHAHLGRALNVPQSLARPHPPILVAGSGERRTLPLVARYADACNLKPGPEIRRQLDLLRRVSEDAGTDYDTIEKTAPFKFDVAEDGVRVAELVGQLRWLGGMGIQTVFGFVEIVDAVRPLEILGRDAIPAVADL